MLDVDNLLTSFYQLDDEVRREVVETIQFKLQYHRDQERAEQVKQIKGFRRNLRNSANRTSQMLRISSVAGIRQMPAKAIIIGTSK